ncbi:hypothetical protein MKX01_018164 [Papaver californicum]|nr:hypothetical protein MKX01_018164 [Papaver californicum]
MSRKMVVPKQDLYLHSPLLFSLCLCLIQLESISSKSTHSIIPPPPPSLRFEGVMKHILTMQNTLLQLNPSFPNMIDGFGNYNLEVGGVDCSSLQNKSILNLYFLDSGDYSTVPSIHGYGWIKASQQFWFKQTSLKLQKAYMNKPEAQKDPAPGLAYFHIPLLEYASFDSSNFTGVKQEGISFASVKSGHDHVNDFCCELTGIHLCYAGGFGYHAYGKAGWDRRARVALATLEKTEKGGWGEVKSSELGSVLIMNTLLPLMLKFYGPRALRVSLFNLS